MKQRVSIVVCCAVLAACAGPAPGGRSIPAAKHVELTATQNVLPKYSIVDLGANVNPVRINKRDHIAGTLGSQTNPTGGFYYDTTLHVLGGIAADLNNDDKVVGNAGILNHDGSVVALAVPKGYDQSTGLVSTINDRGKIVGIASKALSCWPSMVNYRVGKPATVIPTGSSALSVRVNDAGTILYELNTSWSGGCENVTYPRLWPGAVSIPMPSNGGHGVLSPPIEQGTGINAGGDVAGYYSATDANGNYIGMAGFFYKNAVTQEIDPPGGLGSSQPTFEPNGINKADWIVGPVQSSYRATPRAYLWIGGRFTDLNSLISSQTWTLNDATDINDAGYIVGVGTLSGTSHGFLLIPHT